MKLDMHEEAEVNQLSAERMGLHLDPTESYQLTGSSTMAGLLGRKRHEKPTMS
jgi:hypothetical protein